MRIQPHIIIIAYASTDLQHDDSSIWNTSATPVLACYSCVTTSSNSGCLHLQSCRTLMCDDDHPVTPWLGPCWKSSKGSSGSECRGLHLCICTALRHSSGSRSGDRGFSRGQVPSYKPSEYGSGSRLLGANTSSTPKTPVSLL